MHVPYQMKFLSALFNNNSAKMPLTILGILMVIMTVAFTTHRTKSSLRSDFLEYIKLYMIYYRKNGPRDG
jgi:hypothetical protein